MVGIDWSLGGVGRGLNRRVALSGLIALDGPQLAGALVYLAFLARGLLHFTDPDYWWHLRTGQLIVETGSIPRSDPFSFTALGQDWIAHEWLADIAIYGVQSALGYAGNALLFVALGLGSIAIAHRTALLLGVSRWIALLLATWAGFLSFPYWTARPAAFTWLLFAVFVMVIVEYLKGRNRLWLLPLLMLLWANLHGGFVIGLALLGLLLTVVTIERFLLQEGRDLKAPTLVLLASVLVTAINPQTLELWLYPLTYLRPGNASSELISEWQSPDFHSPLHLALGFAIVALVAIGSFRTRLGLFLPALALFLTFMALQSVRHQPLFAIVFLIAGAEMLRSRFAWARSENEAPSPASRHQSLNLALLLTAALSLGVALPQIPSFQLKSSANLTEYPAQGAAYIQENYPEARIFNEYIWGGYLINELYPQKVFIDGRADMYGDAFVHRVSDAFETRGGWETLLDDYAVDLAILDSDSRLAERLGASADWQLVFVGPIESVFLRAVQP